MQTHLLENSRKTVEKKVEKSGTKGGRNQIYWLSDFPELFLRPLMTNYLFNGPISVIICANADSLKLKEKTRQLDLIVLFRENKTCFLIPVDFVTCT
jgi:hypothetical protein